MPSKREYYPVKGKYKFDIPRFIRDVDAKRKRQRLSWFRTSMRVGIHPTVVGKLVKGEVNDPTIQVIFRLAQFLGNTDIRKYIVEVPKEDRNWVQ